jgi:hypothetical protein
MRHFILRSQSETSDGSDRSFCGRPAKRAEQPQSRGANLRTHKLETLAMKVFLPLLVAALTLGACDGPAETAGAEKDKAAADAAGTAYNGDGPNERIGEAQDRAAKAAENAREAEQEALEKEQDSIRSAADIEAERLEQQAKALREAADARADAIEVPSK